MGMMRTHRDLVNDTNAFSWALALFLLFPSAITLGAFAYETVTDEPAIAVESMPSVFGGTISYLWQIMLIITVIIIVVWVISVLFKKPATR